MSAADVLGVLAALEGRGIPAWLDGGWGIDALLGEQTRPHEDVDLVVPVPDVPALVELLGAHGYQLTEGRLHSNFVLTDDAGHKVDVHPVVFDAEGNGHYTMDNDEIWVYPASGLAGAGRIAGVRVRCLTPELQLITHDGYELDDDDRRDLDAIRRRFDLPQ
jgi:lincosamide nucleotidyltransferase A/C/D/E